MLENYYANVSLTTKCQGTLHSSQFFSFTQGVLLNVHYSQSLVLSLYMCMHKGSTLKDGTGSHSGEFPTSF